MDLTELQDRALIGDVLAAYCDLVDRCDVDGLTRLFTDDAVLDLGRGVTVEGSVQLRALLLDRIGRWTTTSHHGSTVCVQAYDGATAATTSYVYAFHDHPADDRTMHLWGRYEDELVRGADRWRISYRRLRVAGVREQASSRVPERFERFARLPLPAR